VAASLADERVVLIVGDTQVIKNGDKSVGAALPVLRNGRQVENCQAPVPRRPYVPARYRRPP